MLSWRLMSEVGCGPGLAWFQARRENVPDAECLRIDDMNHLQLETNPADQIDLSSAHSPVRITRSHVSFLRCYRISEMCNHF
jgi:hypothetical protein